MNPQTTSAPCECPPRWLRILDRIIGWFNIFLFISNVILWKDYQQRFDSMAIMRQDVANLHMRLNALQPSVVNQEIKQEIKQLQQNQQEIIQVLMNHGHKPAPQQEEPSPNP